MKTKFKTLVMLVTLFFAWQPVLAKDEPEDDKEKHELITIKYCDSYKDLHYSNWHTADSVWVITKSRTKKYKDIIDYEFKSDNKKLNKHLKKKAFAVMYNDTLMINALTYRVASSYAHGYRMTDGRIVFKSFPEFNPSTSVIIGSAMGGLIGGLLTGAMSEPKRDQNVLYLISPGQDYPVFVDKQVMEELLDGYPEILAEYNALKKKDRVIADIILPLLRKAKLLKEE